MMNQFGAGFSIFANDQASGVFGQVGKNFKGMTSQAEAAAKKAEQGMMRMTKGAAIVATGFAIVKPLQMAIQESTALNTAIGEVTTLTTEANFPMEKMKALVKDLSGEFGGDAVTQAKALYQTISSGYADSAAAADMMRTANKLAVGGVTDVATSIDGLTNIMNTYKSANLSSADVSDAMFVAMREGKTTIGELASTIGKAAPGAEALGIKFDELLAAVAAVTTKGINTHETMSGLSAAMANINKPTSDAQKEAKRLGIEFSAAAMRSKGLKGFLDGITKSAGYNQDTMAKLFGSIEAFKTMTALAANESEKFNSIMKGMEERAGTTEVAVSKMEKTFGHQMKLLGANTKNILSTIGDAAESLAAPLVASMNKMSRAVRGFIDSLPPGLQKTIIGIASGIGGFISAAGAAMILSGAMQYLGFSMKGFLITGLKLGLASIALTAVLGTIGVSMFSLSKAFKKNTGGIGTDWKGMTEKVKLGWAGMMNVISGKPLSEELLAQLNKTENVGVRGFVRNFELFAERVKSLWAGVVTGFDKGVEKLAGSPAMVKFREGIQSVLSLFVSGDAVNSQETLARWEEQGEKVGEKFANLGEMSLISAGNMMQFGKSFAEMMKGLDVETLKSMLNGVAQTFNGVSGALSVIGQLASFAIRVFATLANTLLFLGGVIGDLVSLWVQLADTVFMTLPDVLMSGDIKRTLGEKAEGWKNFRPFEAALDYGANYRSIWGGEGESPYEAQDAIDARKADVRTQMAVLKKEQVTGWQEQHKNLTAYTMGVGAGPSGTSSQTFDQMNFANQRLIVDEISRLGKQIEKAGAKPIEIYIDGDKMAVALKNSDEYKNVRDLGDTVTGGFAALAM